MPRRVHDLKPDAAAGTERATLSEWEDVVGQFAIEAGSSISRDVSLGVELLADVESLLPSYYVLRGWDENGIPTADKLKQLGIRPL